MKKRTMIPVFILMILPVLVLGLFQLQALRDQDLEALEDSMEEVFNAVPFLVPDGEEGFYARQRLITYVSTIEAFKAYVYEEGVLVYETPKLVEGAVLPLDAFEDEAAMERGFDPSRHLVGSRHYPETGFSIYLVVDKQAVLTKAFLAARPFFTLAAVAVAIAALVVYYVMVSFSKPVSILLKGYNDVLSGDFDHDIPVWGDNQIGLLGKAFNEMKNQIAFQNRRYHQVRRLNEDILRNLSTGILTVDREGVMTACNRVAAELIERFTGPGTNTLLKMLVAQINETRLVGGGLSRIHRFEKGGGEGAYMEITTTVMVDDKQRRMGVLANLRDVTERKRIEMNAERINRLTSLGEVAAALAHEIRNPLSGIKMGNQILMGRLGESLSESDRELMRSMVRESERLDALLTDMLNYSKPKMADIQPVAVRQVLDRVLVLLREQVREKRIEVAVEAGTKRREGLFDKNQLSQVLLNILTNAVNASRQGGRVVVVLDEIEKGDRSYMLVEIRDWGKGIREADLPKVFDPFFTTSETGTGLGLSVVHELVAFNRGEIEIASEEGQGTSVRVLIPVVEG